MKGITKKQLELLQYIQDEISTKGYSPSYREIMAHFGYSSPGTVYKFIQILKRKGLLVSDQHSSRSILPTSPTSHHHQHDNEFEIPLIGRISAGEPIIMFPQVQTVSIPSYLVHDKTKTYVLRAKDDSLNEEMICQGDLLVIEARHQVEAGEIGVVLVNQHETFVKKYYPSGEHVRLVSQSPSLHPIVLRSDTIQLQGVLMGLMRIYG